MAQGNSQGESEASVEQSLIFFMARFVNPFEKAGDEAESCDENGDGQVDYCHIDLAVHSIVDWRESATGDEQVDPRVIESIGDGIDAAGHRIEEMEDCTTEKADGCSYQEQHDWPTRDLLYPITVLVKFDELERLGVDRVFEYLYLLFELVKPSAIKLLIDLLYKERCQVAFELTLRPFELRGIMFKCLFKTRLHTFHLFVKQILVFSAGLLKLVGKLDVVVDHCLLQAFNLLSSFFGKLIVFGNQRQIIKSVHVVIESVLQSLMVFVKVLAHGFSVDHEIEGQDENDDEYGGQTMAPNVDTLIMEHKQAPEDLFGGVEIDAVAMSYFIIVLHEAGGGLVVAYKVPFFIILLAFSWLSLLSFLPYLFLLWFFLCKCRLKGFFTHQITTMSQGLCYMKSLG